MDFICFEYHSTWKHMKDSLIANRRHATLIANGRCPVDKVLGQCVDSSIVRFWRSSTTSIPSRALKASNRKVLLQCVRGEAWGHRMFRCSIAALLTCARCSSCGFALFIEVLILESLSVEFASRGKIVFLYLVSYWLRWTESHLNSFATAMPQFYRWYS